MAGFACVCQDHRYHRYGRAGAAHYGVETVNVLTGFKSSANRSASGKAGQAERYIFGFEESYGYLSGAHVRDKDAVNASLLICEMYAFYAARGTSLLEKLEELYKTYGYRLNTLHSYTFEGSAGLARMGTIMVSLRGGVERFGPRAVRECLDYSAGWRACQRATCSNTSSKTAVRWSCGPAVRNQN